MAGLAAAASVATLAILLGSPHIPVPALHGAKGSLYWIIAAAVSVDLVALHILGVIGSAYAGLRVVSGPQYLLVAGLVMTVVSRGGLRPEKAW